jgi:hypothetical protein
MWAMNMPEFDAIPPSVVINYQLIFFDITAY